MNQEARVRSQWIHQILVLSSAPVRCRLTSLLFNNSEIRSRIDCERSSGLSVLGLPAQEMRVHADCESNRQTQDASWCVTNLRVRIVERYRLDVTSCAVSTVTRRVGLYGQAFKCIWWMPWQLKAMKDVVACDMPRGVGKQTLIRGFPNGETHRLRTVSSPE
jgi:hypothetical protein